MAGVMGIQPVLNVAADGGTYSTDEDALYTPPHFYATWNVNDRYSLGLATFSRFGLGTVFDDDWRGRYNSYEASLQSVSVNPNVAVKVTDKLSAAFGVEAMYLDLNLKREMDFRFMTQPDGDLDLQADGFGYGFNMGLHYQPCEYAKLGLAYRSPVTMKVTGDADFSSIPGNIYNIGAFRDTSASGVVTLPDSFSFGLALYPTEQLSVEVGAVYTMWSKYERLEINFGDEVIPIIQNPFSRTDRIVSYKKWKDVWRFNVGVEYEALDWLDLRLGYVYDKTPVPDEHIDYLLPDSDRQIFSGGVGFKGESWNLDLNYSYLLFADRDIDRRLREYVYDGGVKDADAHIAGVSFTYRF
jgi:long-chain fatty acid transport protein